MTGPQVINLTANEGSSGTGWSYWTAWLKCQRAAWLDQQNKGGYTSNPLAVGMIGHRLLEFHETCGRQDYILEVPQILNDAAADAKIIFGRYRSYYKPGHWGKVVGVEVPLKGVIACVDYTGRADVIIHIHTKTHLKHWDEAGISILVPGYYILDYKFITPPFDYVGYRNSPQFTGYYLLRDSIPTKVLSKRNAANIKGTLVLAINKQEAKRPPCQALFIPPPDEDAITILREQLKLSFDRREEAIQDDSCAPCNLTQCGYGNNRCRYYLRECNLH